MLLPITRIHIFNIFGHESLRVNTKNKTFFESRPSQITEWAHSAHTYTIFGTYHNLLYRARVCILLNKTKLIKNAQQW